jgi:hypothetical protein
VWFGPTKRQKHNDLFARWRGCALDRGVVRDEAPLIERAGDDRFAAIGHAEARRIGRTARRRAWRWSGGLGESMKRAQVRIDSAWRTNP